MGPPIRVLVADDHPIVRGGLIALLGTLVDIEVVGEAEDGASAVREALLSRPDVAVLDLRMPIMDGVQATRKIRAALPGTAVLVLTMFDEDELVADALAAGAQGYLLKGADPGDIERALRTVASGAAVFSPQVARQLLARVRATGTEPFPELTTREREVLELIATGLSNNEIGSQLHIAAKTVGNHISAIFLKLGVVSRAEAIVRARRAGYGS
ncbi:MAG: response regulator transcription factor [Propionibacteriales bacterium]|nr:response regulator transcription factor [Propionibacteriales bacterium]